MLNVFINGVIVVIWTGVSAMKTCELWHFTGDVNLVSTSLYQRSNGTGVNAAFALTLLTRNKAQTNLLTYVEYTS